MALPSLGALRLEPDRQPRPEPAKTEVIASMLAAVQRVMFGAERAPSLPEVVAPVLAPIPAAEPNDIKEIDVLDRESVRLGLRLWRDGAVMWSAPDGSTKSLVAGAEAHGWIRPRLITIRQLLRKFFSLTVQLEARLKKDKAEYERVGRQRPRPDRSPERRRLDDREANRDLGLGGLGGASASRSRSQRDDDADGNRVPNLDWPEVPVVPRYVHEDTVELNAAMGILTKGKPGGFNFFFQIQTRHPKAYGVLRPWLAFTKWLEEPASPGYDAMPAMLGIRILNPWFYESSGLDQEEIELLKEKAYYEALLSIRAGALGYGPRVYGAQMAKSGMLMITERFEMDLGVFLRAHSADPNHLHNVMNEVAAVVWAASLDGMLMCDIKPQNIVITHDARRQPKVAEARVIDFDVKLTALFKHSLAVRNCVTIMNALCLMHTIDCAITFASDEHQKRALYMLAWTMNDAYIGLAAADDGLCGRFFTMSYDDVFADDGVALAIFHPNDVQRTARQLDNAFLRAARRAIRDNILYYANAFGSNPFACMDGIDFRSGVAIVPQLIQKFRPFGPNERIPGSVLNN